jgi:hypothetical protein
LRRVNVMTLVKCRYESINYLQIQEVTLSTVFFSYEGLKESV